jgi:ArsR family transcriptional regulator
MVAPVLEHDARRADHCAEILKAIAHPLRFRIVAALCERDLHVNELAGRLGHEQSHVSQQLGILRMRGLVEARRERGFAHYRLREPRLRELVALVAECGGDARSAGPPPAPEAGARPPIRAKVRVRAATRER